MLVTDYSLQVLVFIAVHTVYTGNTLSKNPQEGKKSQQWEKREALFAVARWPVTGQGVENTK